MVPPADVNELEAGSSLCMADGSPSGMEAARPACEGADCAASAIGTVPPQVLESAVSACTVNLSTFECTELVYPERVPLVNTLIEACISDACEAYHTANGAGASGSGAGGHGGPPSPDSGADKVAASYFTVVQ